MITDYFIGLETHPGAGVMGAFVFPSATVVQALASTFIGSTTLKKGARRFWLHCHECRHALTLRCWNLPWWWSCECCPSGCYCSFDTDSMDVTSCVLMKLPTLSSLWTRFEYELVDVNRGCSVIPKVRVRPATRSAIATHYNQSIILSVADLGFLKSSGSGRLW